MANTAVAGFQPQRVIGGGTITYAKGRVITNNSTAIFRHDALKVTSSGDWLVASATNTAVASVSEGAVYVDANGIYREAQYLPATTTYSSSGVAPYNASYVYYVEDAIKTEFRCSVATAAIALTDLLNNYQMVLGAGSTVTGLSAHTLDSTSHGTTSTLPWRVNAFVLGSTESDPDLVNCHVFARINRGLTEPALGDGTGT